MRQILAVALVAGTVSPAAAQDSLDAIWTKVQPARAVFMLRQAQGLGPGSGTDGAMVSGRLVAEAKLTCTELETSMRMELRVTGGAQTVTVVVEQRSVESRDGKLYRFSAKSMENGRISEQREGQAVLETRDGPGEAKIKGAAMEDVKLSAGTILPGTHILRVMAAAMAGTTSLENRVFYGLDQMRVVRARVTIKGTGRSDKGTGLGEFADKPGWIVREEQEEDGGAGGQSHVTEMFMTEDGVATKISMAMQGLELHGTPLSIEKLPKPDCKG